MTCVFLYHRVILNCCTSITTSGTAFDTSPEPVVEPVTSTYTTNNLNQYTEISQQSAVGSWQLSYDLDGNLIEDNIHHFTYDAENRLTSVTPITPIAGSTKVEFEYDYMSRRVQKQVSTYDGSSWVIETEKSFVYDGWNLIKDTTTDSGTSTDFYVWGLDVSGSLQGAGGIDGLLSKTNNLTSTTYVYTVDANGNVGQLVDSSSGTIAAHYEYDPFGKLLVASGSEAGSNVFRFSTKYYDVETDLYYYGHRYYSLELARWVTRDPIGEQGGANLYSFVQNAPIHAIDPLGTREYLRSGPLEGLSAGDTIKVLCDSGGQEVTAGTITIEEYRPVDKLRFQDRTTGLWAWKTGGGVRIRARFDEEEACCCPDKWCWDKLFGKEGACCCPKGACCCPDKSYRWISTITIDTTPGMETPLAAGYYDTEFVPGHSEFPYYYTKDMIDKGSWHFERIDEIISLHWTEEDFVRFRFIDVPFNPVELLQNKNHMKVKFTTELVCASQGNKLLTFFSWGFEYDVAGARSL